MIAKPAMLKTDVLTILFLRTYCNHKYVVHICFRKKQQELEDIHEDLEFELRCLMDKPGEVLITLYCQCNI